MLILCILRHDQTLDPDVPFGKRPARNRNQMARGGAISAYGWLSPTSQKSQIINSRSSGYRLMLSRDRRRSGAIASPVVHLSLHPPFPPAIEEALNPHSPDGTVFCGAMGLIIEIEPQRPAVRFTRRVRHRCPVRSHSTYCILYAASRANTDCRSLRPHPPLPPFCRAILAARPVPPQNHRKSPHGSDVTSQSNGLSERPSCPRCPSTCRLPHPTASTATRSCRNLHRPGPLPRRGHPVRRVPSPEPARPLRARKL